MYAPQREMYAPGKGYCAYLGSASMRYTDPATHRTAIFAGKDASRGLGMSSLKPEDAVSDYSTLDDKQMCVVPRSRAAQRLKLTALWDVQEGARRLARLLRQARESQH